MWDNEKIKVLVRNTLGCGCPEKVFEKIDVSKLRIVEHEKEVTRIVVGDTLLIYIISLQLSGNFDDGVEAIAISGKIDRDTNSYNRFRLVVSGFEDHIQQGNVTERFAKLFNTDEKMHIHFVNYELVDGLN